MSVVHAQRKIACMMYVVTYRDRTVGAHVSDAMCAVFLALISALSVFNAAVAGRFGGYPFPTPIIEHFVLSRKLAPVWNHVMAACNGVTVSRLVYRHVFLVVGWGYHKHPAHEFLGRRGTPLLNASHLTRHQSLTPDR